MLLGNDVDLSSFQGLPPIKWLRFLPILSLPPALKFFK